MFGGPHPIYSGVLRPARYTPGEDYRWMNGKIQREKNGDPERLAIATSLPHSSLAQIVIKRE